MILCPKVFVGPCGPSTGLSGCVNNSFCCYVCLYVIILNKFNPDNVSKCSFLLWLITVSYRGWLTIHFQLDNGSFSPFQAIHRTFSQPLWLHFVCVFTCLMRAANQPAGVCVCLRLCQPVNTALTRRASVSHGDFAVKPRIYLCRSQMIPLRKEKILNSPVLERSRRRVALSLTRCPALYCDGPHRKWCVLHRRA